MNSKNIDILKPLEMNFSTADAEIPELNYKDGDLFISYINWRQDVVRLKFYNADIFKWNFDDDTADDQPFEVINSTWLIEKHNTELEKATTFKREEVVLFDEKKEVNDLYNMMKHYKLCFNAIGTLDVISSRIELLD